jgi:hypothetical protein
MPFALPAQLIDEPDLEFRFNERLVDPRFGLSIFGPVDSDAPSHPKNISYGVVGTPRGIELARLFLKAVQHPIVKESKNPRLWPLYPGFQAAFLTSLPEDPTRVHQVDDAQVTTASYQNDAWQRAYGVVTLYLEGIESMKTKEERIDVILCVVPDFVARNCKPKSRIKEGTGIRTTYNQRRGFVRGQTTFSGGPNTEAYKYSVDFRRQLKARAMTTEIPTQLVLESTLVVDIEGEKVEPRSKTHLSDRAWNLSTTLFYKAGGKPWRLSSARDGVCYVGLVFRRTDGLYGNQSAACAAQMFLDDGDGVVLRGDPGPWYSAKDKQFHLSKDAAHDLLARVLGTYREQFGKPLKEVFLHYRVGINDEEYEGFKSACPIDVKLVAIRIREAHNELKLFRDGTRPVVRGTLLPVSERSGYLWASGFKPFLFTYDGLETPVPLRIDIEYGSSPLIQVARDILGLTKLNYNECKFGDSRPVTIGFSNAVGEILVSNPEVKQVSPRFKFYI